MTTLVSQSSVKVIGANGQISLGKQFAGRQVLVEESEPGVWMVRTATVVPDNERWLHEAKASSDLSAALDWALSHPSTGDNTDEIIKRLSSRRTCRDCGASNVGVDKCPTCGGEVYQREDDKAEVITRRLEVYAEQTAPIISFYRNEGLLISVSAVGNVEDITASAISALSRVAQ